MMACRAMVEEGADCTSAPCGEGLVCTSSTSGMVCARDGSIGDSCSPLKPCYLARCVNKICVAAAADGDACTAAGDCLPHRTCTNGHCAIIPPPCGI
jgi:hypothetical protein